MAELRYNPMIGDWVMIASNRQDRPVMPKGYCPFCPGISEKIKETYDVLSYDNDFPALTQSPPEPDDVATDFYKTLPSHGKCEVVLYSPDHNGSLHDLPDAHLLKLVNLWCERFEALRADPKIKYVFIFENRGELVGVTQPHPHGQIYGYSVLPKKIELELDKAAEYKKTTGRCLFCDINREEAGFGGRVIDENEDFIAYIPFFADYAYGVYIAAKKHVSNIAELDERGRLNLGRMLKSITGAYDRVFDERFPYMMCMHNAPVNMDGTPYADNAGYFHFHIELYPPLRSADKQQFQASSETGVWAHCNPTAPEAIAPRLRLALAKFRGGAPMFLFREIAEIPRGSGDEGAIADYLCRFAKDRSLKFHRDASNNVMIYAPASEGRENEPALLLQGHTDMVCEKNRGTVHDFTRDPIRLIEKDGFVTADGTTLGADDGEAVAMLLALLDDGSISRPPLECLFTATEETGLIGAAEFDTSKINAKRMINIDSAEERFVTVSCSGGVRAHITLPASKSAASGAELTVSVRGLTGGHSGEDINRGRSNAIKLTVELLKGIDGLRIIDFTGGNKDNAIPRECEAAVIIGDEDAAGIFMKLTEAASAMLKRCRTSGVDPAADITVTLGKFDGEAYGEKESAALLAMLDEIPDGVRSYLDLGDADKPDAERSVRSSENLSIIRAGEKGFAVTVSSRSCDESELDAMSDILDGVVLPKGAKISHDQRYPAWPYSGETSVFTDYVNAYRRANPDRETPVSFAIHAGLECAIFKSKLPELEVISIGCDITDLHTPAEKMDVASFYRVYNTLVEMLAK